MGSYDLVCAVTNTPIVRDDSVVMYRLGKAPSRAYYESITDSPFMMATLPRFGVYDEYGYIEEFENDPLKEAREIVDPSVLARCKVMSYIDPEEEKETNDQNLMFIHREAYDFIKLKWLASAGTEEEALAKVAVESKRIYELILETSDGKEPDAERDRRMHDMLFNDDYMYYYVGRGVNSHFRYAWTDTLQKLPEFRAQIREEIGPITFMHYAYDFHILPSRYGNQDIRIDDLIHLHEIGAKQLHAIKHRWDEDE